MTPTTTTQNPIADEVARCLDSLAAFHRAANEWDVPAVLFVLSLDADGHVTPDHVVAMTAAGKPVDALAELALSGNVPQPANGPLAGYALMTEAWIRTLDRPGSWGADQLEARVFSVVDVTLTRHDLVEFRTGEPRIALRSDANAPAHDRIGRVLRSMVRQGLLREV